MYIATFCCADVVHTSIHCAWLRCEITKHHIHKAVNNEENFFFSKKLHIGKIFYGFNNKFFLIVRVH